MTTPTVSYIYYCVLTLSQMFPTMSKPKTPILLEVTVCFSESPVAITSRKTSNVASEREEGIFMRTRGGEKIYCIFFS